MAIQKNIGKNTIGDNNKMSVRLHDYSMSTRDLSTIVRNTQSPGTLVPNLCLVAQKGDTFDIDIDSNVLTHPTTRTTFCTIRLARPARTPCGLPSSSSRSPWDYMGIPKVLSHVTPGVPMSICTGIQHLDL